MDSEWWSDEGLSQTPYKEKVYNCVLASFVIYINLIALGTSCFITDDLKMFDWLLFDFPVMIYTKVDSTLRHFGMIYDKQPPYEDKYCKPQSRPGCSPNGQFFVRTKCVAKKLNVLSYRTVSYVCVILFYTLLILWLILEKSTAITWKFNKTLQQRRPKYLTSLADSRLKKFCWLMLYFDRFSLGILPFSNF